MMRLIRRLKEQIRDMEKILEIKKLRVSLYTDNGTVKAVRDIDISLSKGETLVIVGESGAGKTITARAIMGLLPSNATVEHGEIIYDGQNLLLMSDEQLDSIRGTRVSMVFQDSCSGLNPIIKVGKQIAETFLIREKMSRQEAKIRAVNLMEEVGIKDAENVYSKYSFQLSGGMRQRIVIAIALANNPDILICDEPTTALDVKVQWQILTLINTLKKTKKLSVIFITHDLGVATKMADRIAVMYDGKIVECGSKDEIFHKPGHPYTLALKNAIPDMDTFSAGNKDLIKGEKEVLLDVQHLKMHFNGRHKLKAVDDISFKVHRGEILGLVGESGCGKTTTGRTILNIYNATGGRIYFGGECISVGVEELKEKYYKARKRKDKEEAELVKKEINLARKINKQNALGKNKKIQMIFQDAMDSLNPRMKVKDIIAEGLLTNKIRDKEYIQVKVEEILKEVGLFHKYADRYPHELSSGQRQRIVIARALLSEPELIIADESVNSLDASVQRYIMELLDELRKKKGISIIFIAHDLSLVKHFTDRVAVMNLGKIVEISETAELFENPQSEYTRELLNAALH